MAKNGLLAKMQEEKQFYLSVGEQTGFQRCFDLVQLCLRDPKVVGNDAWGRERLKRLLVTLGEYDKEFAPAFQCGNESDVLQDHLDRRLREVAGDNMPPFATRYPYIKMYNYMRR
jgi:hypothetical protein